MRLATSFAAALALSATVAGGQTAAPAAPRAAAPTAAPTGTTRPTIVLVHGAFADAMSWARVIPPLQRAGYHVVAVEQPLTSFEADVATVTRVIDAQTGPVVAVGHSYGGATITQAAAGHPNVKALVYVAALAPDAGEAVAAFLDQYPAPLGKALAPDAAGFLYVDRAKLRDVFARDLPTAETDVMAATQKPINGASFQAKPTAAAWKTVPAWYLVARQDRALNPDLERFYARRMKATTVEVNASHVPFLSQPAAVVRLIEQAATAASAGAPNAPAATTR